MYTSQLLNAFNLFQDDIKNSDDIPARFEIFLKFCYKYADKHYLHKFKKMEKTNFDIEKDLEIIKCNLNAKKINDNQKLHSSLKLKSRAF